MFFRQFVLYFILECDKIMSVEWGCRSNVRLPHEIGFCGWNPQFWPFKFIIIQRKYSQKHPIRHFPGRETGKMPGLLLNATARAQNEQVVPSVPPKQVVWLSVPIDYRLPYRISVVHPFCKGKGFTQKCVKFLPMKTSRKKQRIGLLWCFSAVQQAWNKGYL